MFCMMAHNIIRNMMQLMHMLHHIATYTIEFIYTAYVEASYCAEAAPVSVPERVGVQLIIAALDDVLEHCVTAGTAPYLPQQ